MKRLEVLDFLTDLLTDNTDNSALLRCLHYLKVEVHGLKGCLHNLSSPFPAERLFGIRIDVHFERIGQAKTDTDNPEDDDWWMGTATD
ncbi:MAG: hypothetical protein IGR80_00155 [Synechococcales cyanobacterium K44_A2020_017]|nr:hypothetical protein [Synechococcales cyanobacterium K32_A2020_035]MBF2093153.1 hypothetical protein [Synechococcales cyanobacterium K44_A2020_017]